MKQRALFISREQAEDSLILGALKSSGFATEHHDHRDLPSETIELADYSLLVLDAEVPTATLLQLIDRAVDTVPAILLVGGHVQQARLGDLVQQGKAMFMRRPLDTGYLAELLGDIYRDATARTGRGKRGAKPVALDQFGPIYGSSNPMREMYLFLRRAAATDAVLCIHGESGAQYPGARGCDTGAVQGVQAFGRLPGRGGDGFQRFRVFTE